MKRRELVAAPVLAAYVGSAVMFAALPIVVGVLVGWMIPWCGGVRGGITGWSVLHMLWILPAFVVLDGIVSAPVKAALSRRRFVRGLVETAISIVVLSGLLMVFFAEYAGSLLAASMSALVLQALDPLWDLAERRLAEKQKTPGEPGVFGGGDGGI